MVKNFTLQEVITVLSIAIIKPAQFNFPSSKTIGVNSVEKVIEGCK
jgi:hypothetical protein